MVNATLEWHVETPPLFDSLNLLIGIFLEQWRFSIGLFHCCMVGNYHTSAFMIKLSLLYIWNLLKNILSNFKRACSISQNLLESCFYNFQFSILTFLLLLEAGDIESNPGPVNEHSLSILHLNIRSIRNKISYIQDYLSDFKIVCFSETHLDQNISSELLSITNYFSVPYRKDRNMHGGGLLLYINSSLVHRRRPDLEIFCEESVWTEVKVKQDIYLIGLFYSPTTADNMFLNNFDANIENFGWLFWV